MERRDFIGTMSGMAIALAAQGYLPLLAAEKRTNSSGEPCAIEPITSFLPTFSPAQGNAMTAACTAQYALIIRGGRTCGSMNVSFKNNLCQTTEVRNARVRNAGNTIKTTLHLSGENNAVSEWSLVSSIGKRKDTVLKEKGTWDGKSMVVEATSWKQEYATSNPLIARWGLLSLIASGKIKEKPLIFDMLDDSTLRPEQTLRYTGEVEIPIKGGRVTLDSYAQTGQGIVPTHYLVDAEGRVQLISMSMVNWALRSLNV